METKEIIAQIFKETKNKYDLSEFDNLGKPIHEILSIYPKTITSGKDTGQTKYFLNSIIPFYSGTKEIQVYDPNGKSAPEEIVRQLWLYKLINVYQYKVDEIQVEKPIPFGTDYESRKADIVVHLQDKTTPKIVFEIKKPNRKDGIEQLKSYLNAQGAPIGVWSNGSTDRIVLYRPYPKEFNDTLAEIPRRDQESKDVLEAKRTLAHLVKHFNFKNILESLEELVLADSGRDAFDEIFKIIFAKIYDEIEAENRPNQEVYFTKKSDPDITYERINGLFKQAIEKWRGIFEENDKIKLTKDHLSVCIGPIERVRLMGSNLRIMDDAFEFLIPQVAKKKQGQFFTPRYVIDMCVRMLNPKPNEYVLDPACGSSGFLLHAMDWVYPVKNVDEMEKRKHRYASKYLWGIDFSERTVRTSRALMLIAGDGHTNIFGPDVSSLNPKEWFRTYSGQQLINELRKEKLLMNMPPHEKVLNEDEAWEYYKNLKFDVILTNPPFAGEIKDRKLLGNYTLAKNALRRSKDKEPKEERDVLFIERIIDMLKPGGRAAIVLPQGKFNNSSLAFIREYILHRARLLAVVGLHQNTFKPHTGTKTSVMFIQKYTDEDLKRIEKVKAEVAKSCPDYEKQITELIEINKSVFDISEEDMPENILDLINEFYNPETDEKLEIEEENATEEAPENDVEEYEEVDNEEKHNVLSNEIDSIKSKIVTLKDNLSTINYELDALKEKHSSEQVAINETYAEDKQLKKAELKKLNESFKVLEKEIKVRIKERKKSYEKELKIFNVTLERSSYQLKLLTNKGKLQLILEDEEAISILKNRFVDSEVSKKLDYPIFMAVSEHGGKDNSGRYVTLGETEEGVYKINQDLVNYEIEIKGLDTISKISESKYFIAELFIKFAKENKFNFWM